MDVEILAITVVLECILWTGWCFRRIGEMEPGVARLLAPPRPALARTSPPVSSGGSTPAR